MTHRSWLVFEVPLHEVSKQANWCGMVYRDFCGSNQIRIEKSKSYLPMCPFGSQIPAHSPRHGPNCGEGSTTNIHWEHVLHRMSQASALHWQAFVPIFDPPFFDGCFNVFFFFKSRPVHRSWAEPQENSCQYRAGTACVKALCKSQILRIRVLALDFSWVSLKKKHFSLRRIFSGRSGVSLTYRRAPYRLMMSVMWALTCFRIFWFLLVP